VGRRQGSQDGWVLGQVALVEQTVPSRRKEIDVPKIWIKVFTLKVTRKR